MTVGKAATWMKNTPHWFHVSYGCTACSEEVEAESTNGESSPYSKEQDDRFQSQEH